MFHTPAHKLPAAALHGLPIRSLADYIAKVEAFATAESEFERVESEHEFKCQCGEAVRDAQCWHCGEWHDNWGFESFGS